MSGWRRASAQVGMAIVLLVACGHAAPGGAAGVTTLPTIQLSPSPSGITMTSPAPTTSPSTSGSPEPVPTAPFPDCTLPYAMTINPGSGEPAFQGGFVSGPGGTWRADPGGSLTSSGNVVVTSASPVLTGSSDSLGLGPTYDRAVARWLPVERAVVRADGLAYAFAETVADSSQPARFTTRIHLVSLPGSVDRVIYTGPPSMLLSFESEGLYLSKVAWGSDAPPLDTELLDLATGATRPLPWTHGFTVIVGGVAWTDGFTISPQNLDRIDMATGSSETWVDSTGEGWIDFAGLDAQGHPIVQVNPVGSGNLDGGMLYLYTAPQIRIALGHTRLSGMGVTDAHGTWLPGFDGIYLLEPGPHLVKVSDVTGGEVAGGCS